MNKYLSTMLLFIAILIPNISVAEQDMADYKMGKVDANLNISSDYVWRGKTQLSDNADSRMVLQGGFDYTFNDNVSIGVWLSNIDFNNGITSSSSPSIEHASLEIDYYGEYTNNVYEDVDYGIGFIAYRYPNAPTSDFSEVYLALYYSDISVIYYYGVDDAPVNIELVYERDLLNVDTTWTLGDYKEANKYYSLDLEREFGDLDLHIGFTKNDDNDDKDQVGIIVSIGKSF